MLPVSVFAPPSKSMSHRLLMGAALACGVSSVDNVLESDDTARTREVLAALGAGFERTGAGRYSVTGLGGAVRRPGTGEKALAEPLSLFVGESGTTCRLAAAVCAAGEGVFRLHGAGRMHERPMGELIRVLESLGAHIWCEGQKGCLPLTIEAKGLNAPALPGGIVTVACDESSQYLSGLLLAAPLSPGGLTLALGGTKAVSWPYVGLTLAALELFGITVCVEEAVLSAGGERLWRQTSLRGLREAVPGRVRFRVPAGTYRAGRYCVEGDWSGASYFLAAGAVGSRAVRVRGLLPDSLQGDAAFCGILEQMGARLLRHEDGVTVFPSELAGATVDLSACPDLAPALAAVAAHARGATRIINAAHLRLKESDRLAGPAAELRKVGCRVVEAPDGMVIEPPEAGPAAPLAGTVFRAYGDHRMAMSLPLLGLAGRSGKGFRVLVDDPDCVSKSFPDFEERWRLIAGE